jgi:ubiquinol-cytochrome c reductase cytochrome b subunit
MKSFLNWLDSRTGCKKLLHEALYEKVPGGARWRYVWGSTLTFALVVQFITGLFLWMAYNPSSQTAWESVYYIQNHMTGGAWLRGIHHFTAHAMNVLLVLHLMQVVIDGAYKAPREVNFWFGFILLLLVLALSLTGYLLPWDQKGFWATKVATNIVAITPFIGPELQKLIIGGTDYGHHTLSRFFALHAGFLPAAIVILLVGHIYLFRRHGLTVKEPRKAPDTTFWPDQVLKDAVACLAVLATVLFLIIAWKGAALGGPADPTEPYAAARPEWYFMFLFQFLKYFPGGTEVLGAIVIPTVVLIIMCLMPFFGKWRLGHRFNVAFLGVMLIGIGLLTILAYRDDGKNPAYQVAVAAAEREALRVKAIAAAQGIPVSGAVDLLRGDPYVQGPKLFARNCASCHRYDGHDGLGSPPKDPQSAPDLKGFASREWIARLLDPAHIATSNYFGGTKFANGKMVRFVKKDVAAYTPEQKEQLRKVVIALSAEAKLKSQHALDAKDASEIAAGRELAKGDIACTDCHAFGKPDENASAPDLTGYGSREWLVTFISNPAHPNFYGKRNDRMPRFGEEKILDAKALGLLADWLRGEWYEPATTAKAKP